MACRVHIALFTVMMVAVTALAAGAQLLPQVTPKPAKAPATKPAQIVVETSPNAEVYLDDQYTGRASAEGRLVIGNPKPGDHNLRVSLAGKKDFQREVTVVAGQVKKITVVLEDLAGTVVVQTSPGAAVFLDDSSRGTADASGQLAVPDVVAGSHELRIAAPGKREYRQKITVPAGQATRIAAELVDLPVVTTNPTARAKGEVVPATARTHEELVALAHRADRDYFEFNLSQRKAQQKVGTVTIELEKTDTERNVFTVTLMFDDKPHVYSDKPVNQPVYFYVQGTPSAEELVVNKLGKDSIAGYISTPKGFVSSTPNAPTMQQSQGEGGGTGGGIFSVGGGVSAPIPIYKPEPGYSEEARKAKYQGTVVLQIVVDAQGNVNRDVRVVKPLGLGLDEKAVETVRTWKFKPALRDGVPVPVRAIAEVSFRLFDLQPGTVRENRKDGLKYVWIPPGSFQMGCSPGDEECGNEEKPPHQVTISKGFWMGQTEVTVGAYKRFAAASGRQMPNAPKFNSGWANDGMPIVMVSWDDAHDFCTWAGGRLPTEAEWEYAARGGSTAARYGPIDEVAWYGANSEGQTHPVGEKRANGFGLFDVLGNVWEWVNDWYDQNYYQNSPSQDPSGPTSGQQRVLRGGSWVHNPRVVRVSHRPRFDPTNRYSNLGVRCGGELADPLSLSLFLEK